jgi:hypothetical protein
MRKAGNRSAAELNITTASYVRSILVAHLNAVHMEKQGGMRYDFANLKERAAFRLLR